MERLTHHVRETFILFGINLFSNLMALLSTVLIFLFLAMILVGWRTVDHWMGLIREGAEIQVFQRLSPTGAIPEKAEVDALTASLSAIQGIGEVRYVDPTQAKERMTALMGEGTDLLGQLGENPFRPFHEARIRMESMDGILKDIAALPSVETVRDNRDILDRLVQLEALLRTAGIVFGSGAGIFTLVLLSHIIRSGVLYNREQIRTLRLLGAPEGHIAMPFILFGVLLGAGGALLAAGLTTGALDLLWAGQASPLPFLPLPSRTVVQADLFGILGGIGIILGMLGSLSGLSAAHHGNDAGHFR